MKLKRILLAEDSQPDVELTLAALAENNLANAVDVVRDGAEALDYLHHRGAWAHLPPGDPVVVLLDLKMPKLDGLEVLEKVKGDAALRCIPIVVLTSSREEQDLSRSYELGANAFVVKPVEFQDFVVAVKKLGCFWALINEPPPGATPAESTACEI